MFSLLRTLRKASRTQVERSAQGIMLTVNQVVCIAAGLLCFLGAVSVGKAQPLVKSAIQVDPGNTKETGTLYGYRLTYNCSSTNGPCLNAQVVDLLPAEVQYVSSVPASPTGDVAAINVTPNYMGSGRTRVQYVMISPLPAGNTGDLLINVRFPNGSTPDGTQATNTADGINLGESPGTFTTPPVTVTGKATVQATTALTLLTSPANLDRPEQYRYRLSVPNNPGALNITAAGPVVVTLPPGTVFNGATPAADCQPGCVGTTPATVTFSSPFALPIQPNQNGNILLNVTFPSATFSNGSLVTTTATADGTPLGETPQSFSIASITHPVTTFVPSPGASLAVNINGNSPNPPTLNQTYSYDLNVGNTGNVPLDNMAIIGTLPIELQTSSVTTGAYTNLSDFAAGEGVRVSYEKNTAPGVFTLWGSSPNTSTNTTLTAPPPGLGAGEYMTRIRWEYGQAQPGMAPSIRPFVTGRIINPDNGGGPVAIGNSIQFCAALTAVYTAGPTNVNRNDCETLTLSGPFVQLNPAMENAPGGGPFNPGQVVTWRSRVRSDARSSDPVPLKDLVSVVLLDERLAYSSWSFDDQGTGLPAPQNFEVVPGSVVVGGKTYTALRWRWNAGSGNLGANQQVWINVSTTVKNLPSKNAVEAQHLLYNNSPGLGSRCSGSSIADGADLDQDGNTAETVCRATASAAIACFPVSVSVASGTAVCAGSSVSIPANASSFSFGYQWLKNGSAITEILPAPVAPLSLTNVQTGDEAAYQVVVYGSCESTTSTAFSLSVSAYPIPTVSPNVGGTLTCAQTSLTLTAAGGSSYTLSDGQQNTTGQFVVNKPGTYTVTVSNPTGCTATATTQVFSNTTTPSASLTSSATLTCSNPTVMLMAQPAGQSSYAFSGPGLSQRGPAATATVSASGSYSVTVTGSNGCTATATTQVYSNTTAPSVNLSNTGPLSANNPSVTLTASPVSGASYAFSAGASQPGGPASNTATVTVAGSYSVVVTGPNGCTASASTSVTTTATPTGPQTACRNSRLVLSTARSAARYEWYKNGQTAANKLTDVASIQVGTSTASLTLVSVQTNATYYVKEIQANGSFSWTGPFSLTVDTRCTARQGQEEAPVALTVEVVPNPVVGGQLQAVVRGAGQQPLRLRLIDGRGLPVVEQHWSQAEAAQTVSWDISQQPTGVYLLQAQTQTGQLTVRVLHR